MTGAYSMPPPGEETHARRQIAVIILLLFGAKRIPELMRSIGGGFREFKKGIQEDGTQTSEEEKQRLEREHEERNPPQ